MFSRNPYVLADMIFVHTIGFKNVYILPCIIFLLFSTDYLKLFPEMVSTGKPVSFPSSNEDKVHIIFNPVFIVFILRAIKRDVNVDSQKEVLSKQTVRDTAMFFDKFCL